MRLLLAFQCFFLILFGRKLPEKVAPYLPEGRKPEALPPPKPEVKEEVKVEKKKADSSQPQRDGALVLLSLFQREGRLVDFLREGLDGHDDAQIGAAARDVHRGCKKVLDEHFAFEPMLPGDEEAPVTVPRGFDPA